MAETHRTGRSMNILGDSIKIAGFVINCIKACLKVNAMLVVGSIWYVVSKMSLDPNLIVYAIVIYAFIGGSWDTLKKGLTTAIKEVDDVVKEEKDKDK